MVRAHEIPGQILDDGRRRGASRDTSVVEAIVAETVARIGTSTADPAAIRLTGSTDGATVDVVQRPRRSNALALMPRRHVERLPFG